MSAVVVLSFVLFAVEQAGAASEVQRRQLENVQDPELTARDEARREREHGEVREYIDDANDHLVAPFTLFVEGQGLWARRIVTGALAVLLYGVVVTFAANYLRK